MQPGRDTITLEHGKDRRYAKAAARRIGDTTLKSAVKAGESKTWSKLYNYKYRRVTGADISNARLMGFALNYKFTEFKTDQGVTEEVARDFANNRIGATASTIGSEHMTALRQGLGEIAGGSTLQAALSFTRKSTAVRMLEELS